MASFIEDDMDGMTPAVCAARARGHLSSLHTLHTHGVPARVNASNFIYVVQEAKALRKAARRARRAIAGGARARPPGVSTFILALAQFYAGADDPDAADKRREAMEANVLVSAGARGDDAALGCCRRRRFRVGITPRWGNGWRWFRAGAR